jgi:hypothetical protein
MRNSNKSTSAILSLIGKCLKTGCTCWKFHILVTKHKYVRFLKSLIKGLSKSLNYPRQMSERFTTNLGGDSVYISGNVHTVYNMLFKST